jgi:hypothetical protein
MAGLVRLYLEAAPGYISSRYLPSISSNYRISFKHSFLHYSLFTFSLSEASNSRRIPWPWLRSPRPRRLSKFAVSQTPSTPTTPTTRFFTHASFTHLLSTLNSSGLFSLPSNFATIPSSTKHPRSLFLLVGLQGSCILLCILFCILTPNYDRLALRGRRQIFSLTRLLFSY